MTELSDGILIEEIKKRFNQNKRVLHDLKAMNRKLDRLNEKLKESEALKSNFLSNIRNEINNPLTSILGLSREIVIGDVASENTADAVQMIYNEAFDLDFQLRNIFIAADLEAGENSVSIANVDTVNLVRSLMDSFRHRAESKDVSISLTGGTGEGGEALFFRTDPEKFRVIVANLLANAIEFSGEGKEVFVDLGIDDGRLRASVRDNGIGIAKRKGEEIFDRFKQLQSGVCKTHRGHGLGLSVTKALCDLLCGEITFTSRPGKGSVFTVLVPEADASLAVDTFSEEGNEFIFESEEEF